MSGPYTSAETPALRGLVERDLASLRACIEGRLPGASLTLAGSFAHGEAVAWVQDGRLHSLSDYDLFLALPGPAALSRLHGLGAALEPAVRALHNPSLDLNLALPGVAGGAGGPLVFALHALHEAQLGLLSCADPGLPERRRRHGIGRAALGALRAAWNLEAPAPAYTLREACAALEGPWGRSVEPSVRGFVRDALEHGPGLGITTAPPLGPAALDARWVLARRLVAWALARWLDHRERADDAARRALDRERWKGRARLVLGTSARRRPPRWGPDVHHALLDAREALLDAVRPGSAPEPKRLARGWCGLGRLGLLPSSAPLDPVAAWRLAREASALPNPLRWVVRPFSAP